MARLAQITQPNPARTSSSQYGKASERRSVVRRDAYHQDENLRICLVCLVGATGQGGAPMSLRKLWNSLRGTSSEPESPAATDAVSPAPSPAPAAIPAKRPLQKVVTAPAPVAEVAPPRRSILSLRSRGEHDALLKMIAQTRPTSILEIGVGNGSRMPAILASVAQSGAEPGSFKAIVIDEFEMAGGEVTMRDYHRQLAGLTIRPVIFPESVARGLVNVAHRFGPVDMILVDANAETAHTEGLAKYLGKVSHAGTVVLSNFTGKWATRQSSEQVESRAA